MGTVPDIDLGLVDGVLDKAEGDCAKHGETIRSDHLIPLLQAIQEAYGYLPAPALERLSKRTRIPLSQIHGVITFYAQFYTEPHGKHTVRCCRGTACHVRGGKKVISAVKSTLGIAEDETTEDMQFSLEAVACLGACALAPVAVVDNAYYGKMTGRRAEQILRQMIKEES